ncbi:sensor histidine kinase [Actinoplanes couchii]|uniref:Integral membrane sensor signal transduction histidine kinase n=1 Tax=Actinoplanes couchii TaxID=403638 RepID=A0ABQ3XE08_9ACTN|nr:sensor histidine kinase [Actinoplanes couchii]MDR6317228.1 two-component system sensor histidine kinase DesK [Actinoplanes couchii]GID56720.1 hypothetical protein Aco03nite_051240 [Actinoplanes couchii]
MTGQRRRGWVLLAAHTLWLWFLLPPALTIERGDVLPAVGLALFVLLSLAAAGATVTDLPIRPGVHRAGLAGLALLGVGLAAFADSPAEWLILFLFVAAAGAAGLARPVAAFLWIGGSVTAVLVIAAVRDLPADDAMTTAVITLLAGTVTVAFARLDRLVGELRRTQQELARTMVEKERLRFAKDLHDLLGHTLSLVVVKAQVVRHLTSTDPARAATEAADIERIGRTALTDVREAVSGYREQTLAGELENARAVLAAVGIDVTVTENTHAGGGSSVGVEADDVFRWVLREALTNVLRHSRASRCDITIDRDDGGSVLTVRDDGVGGQPRPGNGLRGLTERLGQVGGTLLVGPATGGGLLLTARVPMAALPARSPGTVSR